jgi:hypothetical protein
VLRLTTLPTINHARSNASQQNGPEGAAVYRIGRSGSTQDAGFLTATSDSKIAMMPNDASGLTVTGVAVAGGAAASAVTLPVGPVLGVKVTSFRPAAP